MDILDFPSSPPNGDVYPAPNKISYVFDGVKWVAQYAENLLWKKDQPTQTITPVAPDDKLSVNTYVIEDLGDL